MLAVAQLGLPILVSELGHIATGFADNVMVGHYSTAAIASASMVNNVFNIPYLSCIGFAFGITPLVGMRFAQKNGKAVGLLLRNGAVANLIFAAFVTLVMLLVFAFLDRLGQPDELLPLIRPYFLINLLGIIPVALFNVFAQWSYGIKQTHLPMWITLASNIVNVVGNYVLIFGKFGAPEMGLVGAGLSTLVSRVMLPVVALLALLRSEKYRTYADNIRSGTISAKGLRKIARTSFPVSFQMSIESACFSVAAIMMGWLGTIPLAAYQIMTMVSLLGFCVYYSIASSGAVLVANAAGKSDRREMRRVALATYNVVIMVAIVASLAIFLFGEHLIRTFTNDTELIAYTVTLIPPLLLYQFGDATQITFANCLRGSSNVMPMLWTALVSYILIGLPATYIMAFPLEMGGQGVIYSFSISLFLAAALYLFFFLRITKCENK